MSTFEDTVTDLYTVKFLKGLVRVGASPWNESDCLSGAVFPGIDITVFDDNVAYGMVCFIHVKPPWRVLPTWILIAGCQDYTIVIGVEEHPFYADVSGALGETEAISADTAYIMKLHVSDEHVVISCEVSVIVVCSDFIEV